MGDSNLDCMRCGHSATRHDARFCDSCGAELEIGEVRDGREPLFRYGVVDDPAVAEAVNKAFREVRNWPLGTDEAVITRERIAQVKYLFIQRGQRSYDLEGLQYAKKLKTLYVTFGSNRAKPGKKRARVKQFDQLGGLPKLWSLHLESIDIEDLRILPKVKAWQLELDDLPVRDLSPLSRLPRLTSLSISRLAGLTDLRSLAGLASLTSLEISEMPHLSDLSPLANLKNLQCLRMRGGEASEFARIQDLHALASLRKLETLQLEGLPNVRSLDPLAGLPNLDYLYLEKLPEVKNLAPIGTLTKLISLTLKDMPRAKNVRPLASLVNAEHIVLHQFAGRMDVRSLSGLKAFIRHSPIGMADFRAGKDHPPLSVRDRLAQRVWW